MRQKHLDLNIEIPDLTLGRQDLSLIGIYANIKGIIFKTKKERSKFFNKWIVCSQSLLKSLGMQKCLRRMDMLNRRGDYDWNLASVGKEEERAEEADKQFEKMYPKYG